MTFPVSILGALVPIFVVILSGYGFRRFHFPGDVFWPYVERFTYFVLFPCLLLQKTATASLDAHTVGQMVGVLFAGTGLMAGLLFLMLTRWSDSAAAFTSFFQGGIRFNTYVGLSAAYALFGNKGLTLAAVAIAVLIPFVNLLCVTVLVSSHQKGTKRWRTVGMEIIRNPLIIACTTGIIVNASGIGLHEGVSNTLDIFGRASLPLGLLAVGAGLELGAVRGSRKIIMLSCFLKLIMLPLLVWMVAQVLNADIMTTAIAVLFAALPGSPSSYILARQLGGDSSLMASIVTVQIVVSMLTLPVATALMIF
jgi:predicted permease